MLDFFNPWVAIDRRNGNLYATWEDGRFSNFQHNDIALSMSADGGFTWSTPIRVNQTPTNMALATREAFLPFIAVTADGTIGVTCYDFRFNNSTSAGLPADRWLVSYSSSPIMPRVILVAGETRFVLQTTRSTWKLLFPRSSAVSGWETILPCLLQAILS